jgi:biopolymer transport protein ExbD
MSLRTVAQPRALGVNLTPMIDIVFLLIVFFLLTAQLSSQQILEMELPRTAQEPDPGVSDGPGVLNVVPLAQVGGTGGDYRLGTRVFRSTPAGFSALDMELRGLVARDADAVLVVRADRAEDSARVVDAVRAAGRAGIRRVEVAVVEAAAGGDP